MSSRRCGAVWWRGVAWLPGGVLHCLRRAWLALNPTPRTGPPAAGIANTGVVRWGGKLLALYEVRWLVEWCVGCACLAGLLWLGVTGDCTSAVLPPADWPGIRHAAPAPAVRPQTHTLRPSTAPHSATCLTSCRHLSCARWGRRWACPRKRPSSARIIASRRSVGGWAGGQEGSA